MALSRLHSGQPCSNAYRAWSNSKTKTVNSALYVKGGPPCTQSLSPIDINKQYEVTWPKSVDLIGWRTS